ncbi:MAG TPA: hypothetical protein VFQ88_10845 [Nevskiaceae bacterium]|nr:hypothetical protein [Nevskiaceae bacterium]
MTRHLPLLTACALLPILLSACGGGAGALTTGSQSTSSGSAANAENATTGMTGDTGASGPTTTPPVANSGGATGASTTASSPLPPDTSSDTGHTINDYYGQHLPPAGGSMDALQVGCDWFRVYDSDVSATQGNTAFPDTHGVYWIAAGPTNPAAGDYLAIAGRYPAARYFSFQTYDQHSQLKDALTDFLISPAAGSLNPFKSPSIIDPATQPGGNYNAQLVFGTAPSPKAPNTLYRGTTVSLAPASANPVTTSLIYRVYLAETGSADPTGGVGLPTLVLHTASGNIPLAQSPDAANCRQVVSNYLASLGGSSGPQSLKASDPPTFTKFTGVAAGLGGQGTGVNANTGFLYARTESKSGTIVMVRGRAPSYAQQPDSPAIPDVRYWSICENDYDTQQVTACTADREANLDRSGYYNVVISTPAQRPAVVTAANHYNWLPWGVASQDTAVIYRNLLAAPNFGESVQAIPKNQAPAGTMYDYTPQISYCQPSDFVAGNSPAQVFANCQASDTGTPGLGSALGGLSGLLNGTLGGLL